MCELFAIDSRRTLRANRWLGQFFEDSPYHPDGWGLAWHEGTWLHIHKEPLTAADSNYLRYLLDEPVRTNRLIAHIRNATRGVVSYENCHPFVGHDMSGRRWVIAHNGTILNSGLLAGYDQWVEGNTDSEQVVLFLMDLLDEAAQRTGRDLDFEERFAVLASAVEALSDFNKLNLVIDDGEYTYVHTNTVQHTLFVRQTPIAAFFCTRPLDDDSSWEPVAQCRLIAYRNGRVVRMAAPHGGSFCDNLYLRIIAAERIA